MNPGITVSVIDGTKHLDSVEALPYPNWSAQASGVEQHHPSVCDGNCGHRASDVDEHREQTEQRRAKGFDSGAWATKGDDGGADSFTLTEQLLNSFLKATLCATKREVTLLHSFGT